MLRIIMKTIRIYNTYPQLARGGACFLYRRIKECIDRQGEVSVFLSGGHTPQSCYRNLALLFLKEITLLRKVLLKKIDWYFSDERWVPQDHSESNAYRAEVNLLDPLAVPGKQVHSWQAMTGGPLECVKRYNRLLEKNILRRNLQPGIVLLGMGGDGHTASLFPGGQVLFPDKRLKPLKPYVGYNAVALQVENRWRLSLTPQFINKARLIVFLITGTAKKNAFTEVLRQSGDLPMSWVRGQEVCYLVTTDVVDKGEYSRFQSGAVK